MYCGLYLVWVLGARVLSDRECIRGNLPEVAFSVDVRQD